MTVNIWAVTTHRLVLAILDLLGKGWRIERVRELRSGWFLVTASR